MEDEEQAGQVLGADHAQVDADACRRIVEAARAGDAEPLQAALRDASADERSSAAQELADDPAAYTALHDTLRDLGIAE